MSMARRCVATALKVSREDWSAERWEMSSAHIALTITLLAALAETRRLRQEVEQTLNDVRALADSQFPHEELEERP
jgi:hypothetical protein